MAQTSDFTISFSVVAVAAQQDFFSFSPLDDAPITIVACILKNVGIAADAGDAKEQLWGVEICRGNTSIGSGGSNPTGVKLNTLDTTTIPTTNLRANDTTKISAGTRTLCHADGFNHRVGWEYIPTPDMQWTFRQSDNFIAVQLMTTPSESVNISGTLYLRQG